MKKIAMLLICLCLIAFIPKAEWDALGSDGQKLLVQSLSQIYFEKHQGVENARVVGRETKSGMIIIEIDQPKMEVEKKTKKGVGS